MSVVEERDCNCLSIFHWARLTYVVLLIYLYMYITFHVFNMLKSSANT